MFITFFSLLVALSSAILSSCITLYIASILANNTSGDIMPFAVMAIGIVITPFVAIICCIWGCYFSITYI